jgi:hypothetical protein
MSKQSMDSQGKTYQADYIRSIRMRKTKQKSKGAVGLSIPTTQYSITRGVHTPWPLKHAQNTTSLSTQPTREARPIQDGEHGAFFEKKKTHTVERGEKYGICWYSRVPPLSKIGKFLSVCQRVLPGCPCFEGRSDGRRNWYLNRCAVDRLIRVSKF